MKKFVFGFFAAILAAASAHAADTIKFRAAAKEDREGEPEKCAKKMNWRRGLIRGWVRLPLMPRPRLAFVVLALGLALAGRAAAQTAPLPSFAYWSNGCTTDGSSLLTFVGKTKTGTKTDWRMNADLVPSSNVWPAQHFYIREIAVSVFGGGPNDYVLIGSKADPGDWLTPPVHSGQSLVVPFPADVAPLFANKDAYLDAHSSCAAAPALNAAIVVWWVPAP